MTNLPHRFRESAFRTYEQSIARAVDTYPEVYIHNTGDLTTTTFSCRMRDAITSLVEHGWPTHHVNIVKLSECFRLLKVAEHEGKVLTGSYDKIKGYRLALKVTGPEEDPHDAPPVVYTVPDLETAKIICELSQHRALRTMKLFGINLDTATWLMNNYDVLLEPTTDGGHLLR